MNLGELFINIVTKGDTKKLDEAKKKLEQVQKTSEKTSEKSTKQSKKEAKANNETAKSIQNISKAISSLSGGIKGTGGAISALGAMGGAAGGAVVAVGALVTAITLAYGVVDRMVNSLAQANQQMITFQRTSGISLASLNKYASANAAVNFNSSIEGTAQSMQRVANNLWDIQMGRGDISPYQELAFVGGKAFNPYGMSVEQVIESVREAIKGVDDLQATDIIQRMGFAPDDLLMLRMSREEFEKINDSFLNPQQREAMNKYALEIKKLQLEFNLLKDKTLLKIIPVFIKITKHLNTLANSFMRIVDFAAKTPVISSAIKGLAATFGILFLALNPVVAKFSLLYLILEDIAYWIAGKGSLLGDLIGNKGEVREQHPVANHMASGWEAINNIWDTYKKVRSGELTGEEANELIKNKIHEIIERHDAIGGKNNPEPVNTNQFNYGGNTVSQSNSIVVNSSQPTASVVKDYTNVFLPTQVQLLTAGR